MLSFQSVRTTRFTFQLKELTIGDIRTLLNIAPEAIERARSEFLKLALKSLEWHKGYEDLTLAHLTAQERMFIEATYLSASSDNPDFKLSNAHYSDFLRIEQQYKHNSVEIGAIQGDDDIWFIQPLTGAMLEVIEERLLQLEQVERIDWILYAMVAQLYRDSEEVVVAYDNAVAYGDWLDERVEKLKNLPESAFVSLLMLYFDGLEKLEHLFKINFDDVGVLALSKPVDIAHLTEFDEKEEGKELIVPARFRTSAVFSLPTRKLFEIEDKNDEFQDE